MSYLPYGIPSSWELQRINDEAGYEPLPDQPRELAPDDLDACLGVGQVLTLQFGDDPICPVCYANFTFKDQRPVVWQVPFHK